MAVVEQFNSSISFIDLFCTDNDPVYIMAQTESFMDNYALNAFWLFLSCIMGNEDQSFDELQGFELDCFNHMRIDYKGKKICEIKNFSEKDRIGYLQDLWRQAVVYPDFCRGLNFPIS